MIRVADVQDGSIADDLGIEAGTLLLRINGAPLRDSVDLLFHQAEDRLELEVETPGGEPVIYEIEKHPDASLGLVPEPDKIRRCTNACAFCFVKGNPKGRKLRSALYVKDDDYRLSFLYGHYVTLTNLREGDWERIVAQRLSPLYVSVHATDPEVRRSILKNPRSAEIGEHLDRLERGGIRYHTQVVLCPGVNDGPVLRRTIDDLYARGDPCLSLSIVPVGLTRHNRDRGIRPPGEEEARAAIEEVDRIRRRARRERDRGWCYAADELFLQAGCEPPGPEYFDDRDLVANGVGAISEFRRRVRDDLADVPRLSGLRVLLVTGTSMGPTLRELVPELERVTGAEFVTEIRENGLYGPGVTTAGLLSGRDHLEAIGAHPDRDLALFSRYALNDEELFLDDVSLEELRRAHPSVEIRPSETVTDVLVGM